MKIHTVKKGETIDSIADKYAILPETVLNCNVIPDSKNLIVGQELLILVPTRTYTSKPGDTIENVAFRFGISPGELITNNPKVIKSSRLNRRELLAIRYTDRIYGIAATNGYYYNGCTVEKLKEVLPYLTYLTVASAIYTDKGLTVLFDDKKIIDTAISNNVIPLLRIYDTTNGSVIADANALETIADDAIALAKEKGYGGITLASYRAHDLDAKKYSEFIIRLRKKLIGYDMLLFTEIDENSSSACTDFADGSIMMYDKFYVGDIPTFEDGEITALTKLASETESSKIFIDIPSLALSDGKYFSYNEALNLAIKTKSELKFDDSSLVSYFCYDNGMKKTKVILPSLKNEEAKLRLINELGFLGISFDIMRTPISHLLAFSVSFKAAHAISF